MTYLARQITNKIMATLVRGKSILFLGPRQTGKTTLLKNQLALDVYYSLANADTRLRYERDPGLLAREISVLPKTNKKPLIAIDEVQKVPMLMDVVQDLIDDNIAQFILTGSSARKLRHGKNINLLPGRVVVLYLDSLIFEELPEPKPTIHELLLYGTLPNIILNRDKEARDIDLSSYTSTYMEDEVRAEALVRNVGNFARFLELAASESGQIINFSKISQDIGVSASTIADYYQILDDCLIAQRIDPIINGITHRRLIKSPKYLFFDLGVRRACANEGTKLPEKHLGFLFEQFVGIELQKYAHLSTKNIKIKYWRDSAGPEIDFVLEVEKNLVPIEVKWNNTPTEKDIRHLQKFLNEYEEAENGFVVCQTPRRFLIAPKIVAIPWQEISTITNL